MSITITGSDTLILNNRPLVDFAEGNCAELKFPNELASIKTGKNGNAIYGLNASGLQAELTLRMLRASPDDKFINGLLSQQLNNFAGMVLLFGQFIKKVGDGAGNVVSDNYILTGGIFIKIPEAQTNVEGEATQSVAVYTLRFAVAPRTIS